MWETTDDAGCVCWVGREIGSDDIKREPLLCEEILDPDGMGSGPPCRPHAPHPPTLRPSGQRSIAPMSFSL